MILYVRCAQVFLGKEPQTLLWAGLRTARVKITLSVIPNSLNFCEMLTLHTTYKFGRGSHNTTGRTAGWTPMVYILIYVCLNERLEYK